MRTENKPKEHSKYKTRTLTNKLIFPSTRGHHKTYMGVGEGCVFPDVQFKEIRFSEILVKSFSLSNIINRSTQ